MPLVSFALCLARVAAVDIVSMQPKSLDSSSDSNAVPVNNPLS